MAVPFLHRVHIAANRLEVAARRGARRALLMPPWPYQDPAELLSMHDLTGAVRRELLYLPALPMDFRWQRPQQLAAALAAGPTRVHYVEIFDRSFCQPLVRGRWYGDRLCRLRIRLPGRPNVYRTRLDDAQVARVCDVLGELSSNITDVILVQHPLWASVCRRFADSGVPIIYDRIDLHSGFNDMAPSSEKDEQLLFSLASAVSFSAPLLRPVKEISGQRLVHVPNAAACSRFSVAPPPPDPIVGYVGAIDHWFDVELLAWLSRRRPDWKFRIAGMCADRRIRQIFNALPNVDFLGEIPYKRVPHFFAGSSLLLIPFRRGELVDRVDPVKMYEAWAAGRAVVAPEIPSITMWKRPLLYRYDSRKSAEQRILEALAEDSTEFRNWRVDVATDNSWRSRAQMIEALLDAIPPESDPAGAP